MEINKNDLVFFPKNPQHTFLVTKKIPGKDIIASTFLKLDSWSPEVFFFPIISTRGIDQRKKGKL